MLNDRAPEGAAVERGSGELLGLELSRRGRGVLWCVWLVCMAVVQLGASRSPLVHGVQEWSLGLSFGLLCVVGVRGMAAVFAAYFTLGLLAGVTDPIGLHAARSAVVAGGAGVGAWLILRYVLRPPPWGPLVVVQFLAVSMLATGVTSVTDRWLDSLAAGAVGAAPSMLGSWLSDLVGVFALTPLVATNLVPMVRRVDERIGQAGPATRGRRGAWKGIEIAAQAVTLGAGCVAIAELTPAGVPAWYMAFVPLTWICVRHGLSGATLGACALVVTTTELLGAKGFPAEETLLRLQLPQLSVAMAAVLLGAVVTQRAVSEAALRISEQRRFLALQADQDGIWELDLTSGERYYSARLKQMLGYEDRELAVTPDLWTSRVHPEDLRRVTEAFDAFVRNGGAVMTSTHRVKHRDGSWRWMQSRASALRDATGRALRVAGSVADVTEQREAQELIDRERRMFVAGPVVMFRWKASEGWPVEYVSENVSQYGYTAADFLTGRVSYPGIIHPNDLERVAEEVRQHTREHHEEFEQQYRVRTADGRWVWLQDYTVIVRDSAGKPTHYEGYVIDDTSRRAAEQSLREANGVLELMASGSAGLTRQLEALVASIERQAPGMHCSVLVLDAASRTLRVAAAPSMPEAYNHAINGVAIGPSVGSCGTAAFYNRPTIVSDIETDPLWENFRELAISNGLRSCWSVPINSTHGEVLGTFAMYYGSPRSPNESELGLIARAKHLAAVAIEADQSARELRRSEEEFRLIVETALEGVWLVDENWKTTYANSAMARMLGVPLETMRGKTVTDFMDERGKEITRTNMARREAGLAESHEFLLCRPDGTEVWTLMATNPVVDDHGKFLGALAMVTDITARKQSEDELRRSEERYRTIVQHAPDGIVVLDMDGARFIEVNPAAEKLFGLPREQLIGRTPVDMSPLRQPDGRLSADAAREYLAEAVAGGTPSFQWTHRTSDGRDLPCEVTLVRLPASAGRRVRGTVRDISDRLLAEKAIREHTAALERSNRELEQFAYVASHDLQEPLRMVTSFTQLLRRRLDGKLDAEAEEYIGFACEGAQRMSELINDLLTYSRVRNSTEPLGLVDCGAALARAISNLKVSIDESGAQIDAGAMPWVRADASQLALVLQNLLSNALKFRSAETPEIRVWAEEQRGVWCISVQDNGIGIEPRHRERIFTMFQRLHARSKYPGNGLGLALCKRVVEGWSGRIWVEGAPVRGSIFRFSVAGAGIGAGVEGATATERAGGAAGTGLQSVGIHAGESP